MGELSFWIGDDDLSRDAGDDTGFFGPEPSTPLAIDELSPRENTRTRRLTLGLGARSPGLWSSSTAVQMRLGVEHEPESGRLQVRDQGSYLELEHGGGGVNQSLRLYPIDGDGLRAGWLEALAWGGEAGNLGNRRMRAPAVSFLRSGSSAARPGSCSGSG